MLEPPFSHEEAMALHEVRYAVGPHESVQGSIEIAGGRITHIRQSHARSCVTAFRGVEIDLSGFMIMPGLVNAHDHLHFEIGRASCRERV